MMQYDEDLTIPAFLRLTAEQRREGWERWLASRGGRYTDPWRDGGEGVKRDWTRPRSLTDEEWAYWQDVEARKAEAKREADQPRFEAMRAKAKEDREARAAVREAVRAAMAERPRASMKTTLAGKRQRAKSTSRTGTAGAVKPKQRKPKKTASRRRNAQRSTRPV